MPIWQGEGPKGVCEVPYIPYIPCGMCGMCCKSLWGMDLRGLARAISTTYPTRRVFSTRTVPGEVVKGQNDGLSRLVHVNFT